MNFKKIQFLWQSYSLNQKQTKNPISVIQWILIPSKVPNSVNVMFAQALYLATSDTVYLQTVVSSMLKEQRKLQQVMEDLFVPELE